MTTYYVDDGGSATDPYDTWAKAATSLSALDDAKSLATGDIVYIGHDHVCPFVHSSSRTITGPTSGGPVLIISATRDSSPPTYQEATSNQVDTSEGAYSITFDGSFVLIGIRIKSGDAINFSADGDEYFGAYNCTFLPASNRAVVCGTSTHSYLRVIDCTIDCTQDSSASRTNAIINTPNQGEVINLTLANVSNRSGPLAQTLNPGSFLSGCDASGMQSGAYLASVGSTQSGGRICNVKLKGDTLASYVSGTPAPGTDLLCVNCGTADNPAGLVHVTAAGTVQSTTSIYRTGGASVEDVANVSWAVTTNAICSEYIPYVSPWIYGTLSSTGSKTFSIAIANNSADLTEAEAWIEVEYLGTASGPVASKSSDHRTAWLDVSPVAQTDDTTSTWNGTTLTYMQTLSTTATVGEEGLYRARVCIGKASWDQSTHKLHIDPKVTVS